MRVKDPLFALSHRLQHPRPEGAGPIVYLSKNDVHVVRVLIESNVFIYFSFSEVREL
jgi:hypothetical protein